MVGCTGRGTHAYIYRMVSLGSLGGVMVSTLASNARNVGSIPALGAIFQIFIGPGDSSIANGKRAK